MCFRFFSRHKQERNRTRQIIVSHIHISLNRFCYNYLIWKINISKTSIILFVFMISLKSLISKVYLIFFVSLTDLVSLISFVYLISLVYLMSFFSIPDRLGIPDIHGISDLFGIPNIFLGAVHLWRQHFLGHFGPPLPPPVSKCQIFEDPPVCPQTF